MLAVSGNQTYAIYLYADGLIQWTTSDVQGGVNGLGGDQPPVAGYSAGDGIRNISFMISGSLTNDIINIASTSNVLVPGMWVFQLHEDDVALLYSDNDGKKWIYKYWFDDNVQETTGKRFREPRVLGCNYVPVSSLHRVVSLDNASNQYYVAKRKSAPIGRRTSRGISEWL